MSTMVSNGSIAVWAVALIFAPGLLYATFRRCTPLVLVAGAMVSVVLICLIVFLVSSAGYSPIPWLRGIAVVLVGVLVATLTRAVAARRSRHRASERGLLSAVAMLAVVSLIALWMLAPLALVLHRHGVELGLLTHGNADLSDYVLRSQNMVASGFDDSHHVANGDGGTLARVGYVGANTMLVWLSAITTLSPWQVALPGMAVATCLAAVSLWALASEIWSRLAPAATLPGVVLVTTSGIAAYSYASYFLGAELGLAAATALVAGIVSLARSWSWPAAAVTTAAGGFGVYAYGHIGLLALVAALPIAAVAGLLSFGVRGVARSLARAAVPVVAAGVLAVPVASEAFDLVRAQSAAQAGWPLAPKSPFRALLWPPGLGLPSSGTAALLSWIAVLALLFGCLALASRNRVDRSGALLAALVLLGGTIVVAGAAMVYGAERYQSWKMLQLLMPVALVAAAPAVGLVVIRGARAGATVLTVLAGAALLGPWLQWQDVLASPDSAILTSVDLVDSVDAIQERQIAAVNVRLSPYNETMMAGAMLTDTTVVLSEVSYYTPFASAETCTLTRRSMVSPDADVIPLSGDYVLVERPAACLIRR